MRRILTGFIAAMIFLSALPGCGQQSKPASETPVPTPESNLEQTATPSPEKSTVRIGTLKGPTGMGMSYMMEADEKGDSQNDYEFEILGAPDQLTGKIVQGEVDIAAVPTNLASILSSKTEGKVQLLAVNTLGVLYVLEKGETVHSVSDLKGKKLYSSGKGAAPEYILNYLLRQNGLKEETDVPVEYTLEHSDLATLAVSGKADLVLLPEPFVTTVLSKDPGFRIALNFNDEWARSDNQKLPMGCIIVLKQFAQSNPEAVEAFMEDYLQSVNYVNQDPQKAGELIAKYDILANSGLAAKAIPQSSITLIPAQVIKEDVMAFYKTLFDFDPKAVGGKMPGEDFFYEP